MHKPDFRFRAKASGYQDAPSSPGMNKLIGSAVAVGDPSAEKTMNPPLFFTILGTDGTEKTDHYHQEKERTSNIFFHSISAFLVKKLYLFYL
jgi:hypothetical protein